MGWLEYVANRINNPVSGMTVPQVRFATLVEVSRQYIFHLPNHILNFAQLIGSLLNSYRTFSVGPQGKAGDAEIGCFFLDST